MSTLKKLKIIDEKTTVSRKNWKKNTTPRFRKIGDALLALGTTATGIIATIDMDDKTKVTLMAIASGIGGLGKFFTKLFSDE